MKIKGVKLAGQALWSIINDRGFKPSGKDEPGKPASISGDVKFDLTIKREREDERQD